MTLLFVVLIAAAAAAATTAPSSPAVPSCQIKPPATKTIIVPRAAGRWDQAYEDGGVCQQLGKPRDRAECPGIAQSIDKRGDLIVTTNGPCGSGRFFTATLAVQKSRTGVLCFSRFLLGTRGLERAYPEVFPSVRWLRDLDQDGEPELVLWDSFPLKKHPSNGDHAVIGWVYKRQSRRRFGFSEALTRRLAGELTARLRRLGRRDKARRRKTKAARAKLAPFVSGKCRIRIR